MRDYSDLMKSLVLKDYYLSKGFTEEDSNRAAAALEAFEKQHSVGHKSIENCTVELIKDYISLLTDHKENSPEVLLALARAAYLAGNRDVYIYFTRIVERESIIGNLQSHMTAVLGQEKTEDLFDGLELPPPGAPPEDVIPYTSELMSRMEERLSESECRAALTGNAHGIPAEAFKGEVEKFEQSESLEAYLEDSHKRSVANLQQHADSGKVWFEQIITQPVVDYVAGHKEVLGGVLNEGKILWTKIPYEVESWLNEKDDEKKRYHACHCPMAREALVMEGEKIPRAWCNCTSGYIQQRFNAIFGEKVQVDLLETVLDGDDRCRFAIHVPERFL